jgi:hypothetical protein
VAVIHFEVKGRTSTERDQDIPESVREEGGEFLIAVRDENVPCDDCR